MKFLDIRRDEVAKVWITWTMVALISIGYAIGWSAVHSMLVKRMGVEYLPYTYIGISILGMIGSTVYLSLADALRRDRLLILFCIATGATLIIARLLVTARPEGAFYLYCDCSALTADSFAFARELLEQAGVAATPGLDFGANGPERHIRFAYTTDIPSIEEGFNRIEAFLSGNKGYN